MKEKLIKFDDYIKCVEEVQIDNGVVKVRRNNLKWVIVNKDGCFSEQYDHISEFKEGFAIAENKDKKGKCYINSDGKRITDFKYGLSHPFSEGLAAAIKRPYTWVFINTDGKEVINLKGSVDVKDFHQGLAAVECHGGWGYIDKKGDIVIPYQYIYAGDFNKYCIAYVRDKDNITYCINKEGEYLFGAEQHSTITIGDKKYKVFGNSKKELIMKKLEVLQSYKEHNKEELINNYLTSYLLNKELDTQIEELNKSYNQLSLSKKYKNFFNQMED